MTIAIIYPPTCDPTAPYLSVPILTAWLRSHGKEVLPIDANIEAYDYLLQKKVMLNMLEKIRVRYWNLDKNPSLSHKEQMKYMVLHSTLEGLSWVPDIIDDAVNVLRDCTGIRFYNEKEYERAITTIEAGLQIISAAYYPLNVDFKGYRTPFSILSPDQIRVDGKLENDPFHETFITVGDRISENDITLAGISMAFPGQIQPGFSLALYLKERFPEIHLTVGGPAITQILLRHETENQLKILGPFDSAIIYEGEQALLDLAISIENGEKPVGIINGSIDKPVKDLPPPDFDGLPLEKYLSPELVLPYDPTRGCYWGKCAFCHYGLCSTGTARYRERNISDMVNHIKHISEKWQCRNFYFSQDAFLPKTAQRLGFALKENNLDIRWSTDMRPETALTPDMCKALKNGGALSIALGIESASPRVLKLINKGIDVNAMKDAIKNLSSAGIAVETMCFNNFPTEKLKDALTTIEFIRENKKWIALFINGRFGLSHGSRVANHPEEFGISEIWQVAGDEIGTGLFYRMKAKERSIKDQEAIDKAIDRLSGFWWLHDYPWAGSLSTAHTILWYAKKGTDVFRKSAKKRHKASFSPPQIKVKSRYDIESMESSVIENEAEIWYTLVYVDRAVSPERYNKLGEKFPHIYPVMH
jgi:anaerobic magnesium-protoporphyrin IX monomethyl ester cyclase